MLRLLCFLVLITSCGKDHHEKDAGPDERIEAVKNIYQDRLNTALGLRDEKTGWLDQSCDGFKRTALYAASPGVEGVALRAAEYPGNPGKFHRRPLSNPCWTPELGDVGSKTTWSRDMGMGLIAYAWAKKDRGILDAHAAYGVAHPYKWEGFPAWLMGEPAADGRAIYTPAMLGLVYQGIFALGGVENGDRAWPNIYTKGLTDYQAHLQMLDIWYRGEVARSMGDSDALPHPSGDEPEPTQGDDVAGEPSALVSTAGLSLLQVSDSMYNRIQEHYQRQPHDPFYAYLHGLYSGDFSPAIENCLNPAMPLGDYARADETGRLAYWIFACGQLLETYGVSL